VLTDYFTFYEDTDAGKLESYIEFIIGVAASINIKKLAKTVKAAYYGRL
jgi:hypothetical protein